MHYNINYIVDNAMIHDTPINKYIIKKNLRLFLGFGKTIYRISTVCKKTKKKSSKNITFHSLFTM